MIAQAVILAGVLLVSACTGLSPTAPSPVPSSRLGDNLETIYMDIWGGYEYPKPPECKWRDMEIFAYVVEGRPVPIILLLSDHVHKAYIAWAYVEPGTTWAVFGAEDNPGKWCTYPFTLPFPVY